LQEDGVRLCELIDLEAPTASFHWTTANAPITYTLSGVATVYEPFPGATEGGAEESIDLGVTEISFAMANTGTLFSALMNGGELEMATIKVGRVFVDTPDLGRMYYYEGKLGNIVRDRRTLAGQARGKWDSGLHRWPYYNYEDDCGWRFGSTGCGVNVSSFTLTLATTSIAVGSCTTLDIRLSSGTLTGSYANDRFVFGRFTVTGGVNSGQVRTIRTHTGDLLGLSHPLAINSFTGMTATIFPGCRKRILDDCHSLYNNVENVLGFKWIPIQEDAF
jgi:uncharacterized phage protein (TIGR02218 family)